MHAGTGRFGRVRLIAAVFLLASSVGCAVPQTAERDELEYQQVDSELRDADQYEAFKRACRAAGGIVYSGGSLSKLRPRVPDMSTVRCGRAF